MSFQLAFDGGPLDRTVIADRDEPPAVDAWLNLPRYVFRSTRHGRAGSSFDIFYPADLPIAAPFGAAIELHQYRVDCRRITDDGTIHVRAHYVGRTGRAITPTVRAMRPWLAQKCAASEMLA
ncbi:hypothetical protein [Lacipirellula limnantheis]|uniref:Uncharacterized protein n=1 Tax=Lacipirellula limnantheis TaxID=2528024 RepID=A0A517TYE5_9BACT|nr:hypothetical protein [Lacipirellula limnantheis]QDT73392.1 hypothetical protein I41_25810 [Lacipirellula limnantheis]